MDMHWRDLIRQEADPRHLNAVALWREAPFFSDRERAALHWAEVVNAIPVKDPATRISPACRSSSTIPRWWSWGMRLR